MTYTEMNTAEKLLVEDYLHLVPAMVHALTRPYSQLSADELDELKQIGYLAICEAAKKYDGKRPFQPYANAAIRNAIYDHWRDLKKDSDHTCSLDAMTTSEDGGYYEQLFPALLYQSPESDMLQKATALYLTELAKNSCSMVQKGILSLQLQQSGYTSIELAELFHVPPNHVRAWQSKARNLLKQDQTLYMLLAS